MMFMQILMTPEKKAELCCVCVCVFVIVTKRQTCIKYHVSVLYYWLQVFYTMYYNF